LKPQQICEPAGTKQMISSQFFFIFELVGVTKHLMTGHCFPWGPSLSAYYIDYDDIVPGTV